MSRQQGMGSEGAISEEPVSEEVVSEEPVAEEAGAAAESRITRAIVRRETHSSRAVPATIAAVLIGLGCLYALLESTLKAFGEEPWLLGPEALGRWLAGLPDSLSTPPGDFSGLPGGLSAPPDNVAGLSGSVDHLLLGVAGILVLIIGLLFFLQAILPGRRTRHSIPNARAAVVVDAEVLASSLARSARAAAGVTPEQVMVTVSRQVVQVRLRPTSGTPVDRDRIRDVVEEELRRTGVEPKPDVQVSVTEAGVIGQ